MIVSFPINTLKLKNEIAIWMNVKTKIQNELIDHVN